QASIGAGLPNTVGAVTINKVCGSGLKAVMFAASAIRAGEGEIYVAGGMESMSGAPYVLPGVREGLRMGHGKVIDSMVHDGLWDPYDDFHMGNAAEKCSAKYTFTREAQDAFAAESYRRALKAIKNGDFKDEIAPVAVPQRKGDPLIVDTDEEPGRGNIEKMASLRPAFDKQGTITAANASSINDGAAALVVASREAAEREGMPVIARVVAQATNAHEPVWFTTAPVGAIKKALAKAGKKVGDIDLWEINEAFSAVTMAAMKELDIPHDRVNVNGGAASLGHPIGCSGARILTTLVYALKRHNKKTGLATLCIGGGEAVAVIVERV
ncbi:MAG: acetyl-CoA C-acyltransferase, partial [Myxococcales bacterium]|nr:acetyl-CoA C-acyltransferase [Myxococcales bacterium]